MAHSLSTYAYNVLTCCVVLCFEFMPFKFSVNITLFYLFVCFTNLWFCLWWLVIICVFIYVT